MESKQQTIMKKVQALLRKTVERGCTEEEAIQAAEMADKLMREYDLSFSDIGDPDAELRKEAYGKSSRPVFGDRKRTKLHEVSCCVMAIARYFDLRAWRSGADIIYFGAKSDTEAAHLMSDLIATAMEVEFARYLKSPNRPDVHGRTLRASFMRGMAKRVSERLDDLKAQRSKVETPQGSTALVVIKKQIVDEQWNIFRQGTRFSKSFGTKGRSNPHRNRNSAATNAGYAAGDRVVLNKSVGGSAKLLK